MVCIYIDEMKHVLIVNKNHKGILFLPVITSTVQTVQISNKQYKSLSYQAILYTV